MRLITIILFLFIPQLFGCSLFRGSVNTTITTPKGDVYSIYSKKDALVKYEKDAVKVEVDNRGSPGLFETFINSTMMGISEGK